MSPGCPGYLAGASLNALGCKVEVARNLIRIWVAKYQAGEYEPDFIPRPRLSAYEIKIAELERMVGKLTMGARVFKGGLAKHTIAERCDHIDRRPFSDGSVWPCLEATPRPTPCSASSRRSSVRFSDSRRFSFRRLTRSVPRSASRLLRRPQVSACRQPDSCATKVRPSATIWDRPSSSSFI